LTPEAFKKELFGETLRRRHAPCTLLMKPERWQQIADIFESAIACGPAERGGVAQGGRAAICE
jgi:hypothetical protein